MTESYWILKEVPYDAVQKGLSHRPARIASFIAKVLPLTLSQYPT